MDSFINFVYDSLFVPRILCCSLFKHLYYYDGICNFYHFVTIIMIIVSPVNTSTGNHGNTSTCT